MFQPRIFLSIIYLLICAPLLAQQKDSLRFPISDRRGDPFSNSNKNPFDLNDTSLIKKSVEYDPKTKSYFIKEKIGSTIYRKPTTLQFDEYWRIQNQQAETDYFKKRADALTQLNKKVARPPMRVYDKLFDRIFGMSGNNLKVDIRPSGEVNILAGYQGQNIKNPTLPERARKNGGFDFDMNANLNLNANIGDKLKFPINYNTLSNLGFDNQLKLDYKGMDDEIIKSIEAGNISFQSRGTLIASAQNLFGIKTQLQFGKLFVTAALANQRSSRQTVSLQGGASTQSFQKKLDDYEENRHFLLGNYFRANFNTTMKNLPVVNSQVQLQRVEVWVTNRTGATTEARDIVGLMDLGESRPFNPSVQSLTSNPLPANGANNLFGSLVGDPNARNPAFVNSLLLSKGLRPVDDYEKTFARKLTSNEYYFNPQAGFISVNTQLQADEVLAVAYQYTYNGRVFQVGEFSQDIALDSNQGVQKVLFLKLLKATSQRTQLPIWGWMMKNVYSLDLFGGIQRDDFKLNILYDEPSGGLKRFLPETAQAVEGQPLLRILNLDRLNNRNDPQPDGVFDYIDGFTILPQMGRVVFPLLEPFGRDLDTLAFSGLPTATKNKYVYYQLYDSIKAIAQTYANLNRFVMQGQVKGSGGGSEIYLNTFNIPPGSVSVAAGGQILREGSDYIVDYNLGTVKIINQGILSSNVPVKVSFENNIGFGVQQRGFTGLRLDYVASKKLSVGTSFVKLGERPFFTKMGYGDDPIRNSMYGFDFNYRSDLPGLTRLLNKLPFYDSKAKSSINAYGEAAFMQPGHPPQIGKGDQGLIFIDDFEGTRATIDLRFPFVSWAMASTPQGNTKFPESTLTDSIDYNKNRAKLAWYNIEPNLQDKNSPNNPLRRNLAELSDPRVRQVFTNELFPQRTTNITDVQAATFDLAYYPTDKGPYNFESSPTQINAQGKLNNPAARWGGIMRAIDQTDFETNNIEFVEFWMQNPFITNPTSKGGKLFLNFGNVSEDVLKDGKRFYENGMNTPTIPAAVDSTNTWGKTPVNPIQITQAFSNDPNDRPFQDVGFDGLDDNGERRKKGYILNRMANNFGTGSPLYQRTLNDPSNDNYLWYRDPSFDPLGTGILGRYKNFNNQQGNSPVATTGGQFTSAATLFPDNEDLNRDNTLNETESYYEYEVQLRPGMDVGSPQFPYITDKRRVTVNSADGITRTEDWYLFRIPIKNYSKKVGNIPDFKSIRFARMYLTDFEDSVVLRLARLDLVRNQWRQFIYNIDTTGSYTPINNNASNTTFNTLAVNLEENSSRQPVNYIMPPNVERVQLLSNNGVNLQQNEQALSLRVSNLPSGGTRGVFKILNLDVRRYAKMSMYLHAESVVGQSVIKDDQLNAIIRIGQDFLNNYYEIKIPLKITPPGQYPRGQEDRVWPEANNIDFSLRDLIDLKLTRNNSNASVTNIFRKLIGNKTFSIMGNPNLGEVRGILVGIENPVRPDGQSISTEVWMNELRLSGIDENGGWAALGRVDLVLADLGTLSVSGNKYTQGFGTIEQRVNERAKDNLLQFDIAANIDAGKLVPKKAKLSIPVYASLNRNIRTPEFDPYDLDVLYKEKLSKSPAALRDSIKNAAADQTTIQTINFTNVRVMPGNGKPGLLKLSNFDVSYAYSQTEHTSPIIKQNKVVRQRAGFGYTYIGQSQFKEPFKKLIKGKSPWLAWIRDANYNLKPSYLSFRADINRQFGEFIPRIVNNNNTKVDRVDTTYDKYFTFDRFYNMRWDLTRSLNFDFNATNNARVDEPFGRIDNSFKKDTVRKNFLSGGRNTLYVQKTLLNYNIPLNKFPFSDWITARYSYGTSYSWIGASRIAYNLGNTIENSQENNFNAQLSFGNLYAKSKWLRAIDNIPSPKAKNDPLNNKTINSLGSTLPPKEEALKGLEGKQRTEALQKWRQQRRDIRIADKLTRANQTPELTSFERTLGKFITMFRQASINYSENYRSRLPGYMDSTQFIGQNFKSMAPGLDYVFGKQPDNDWINNKISRGLLSKDSTFNFMFRQSFEQRLSITAQLEPIRELIIDLNVDKTFTKDYTALIKDTTGSGNNFGQLNPLYNGGFSVSYIAFSTLFASHNPNEISSTFKEFESNRILVSKRIAETNPYWQALPNNQKFTADGFARGYGRYSQSVILPAFLAAYTRENANTIPLIKDGGNKISTNPFRGIMPRPNWKITYSGLSKIPSLAASFSNITISHGYNGQLSMNSFNSALLYQDPFRLNAPGFIDTTSGNFIPFFLIPNVSISERFEPLIKIDVTTISQFNFNFEFRKSRQLSMSLIDYQLSESRSTEWILGMNWRKRGFNLPFKLPGGKGKKLQNDLNLKLDISVRDVSISNSRLDQSNAYGTGGQKEITIQPAIDYVLNNRINIKFFFDQRRVTPYISTSAPITNTRAGVNIRISLAQ
ncbi:MAG: cell surface protein SprA [Sphingobacteriia bacterium]